MIILPETSAASNLICEPDFHRTIGRERRERVSQLAWCGAGALIRAAASTQPFGIIHMTLRARTKPLLLWLRALWLWLAELSEPRHIWLAVLVVALAILFVLCKR